MKKNLRVILPVFVLLIGVVAWRIISTGPPPDTRRQMIPLVTVEFPRRETIVDELRYQGDVMPIQQANLFSKVNGNLERVLVDIGAQVKQNQLLALIDTTELAQTYRQNEATYVNARLNYDRTKELSQQNLVAKQDLDNADAAMKVAKANFDAAATRLGYAYITAPFAGFVTKRFLDPGANVTSNNSTLFTLMDLDNLKIIINVQEKDIPQVRFGTEATITVDAFPGKQFTGKVTRFSDAVDLATRTMAVEVDIPNRDRLLKPGMFANIVLIVGEHPNALTISSQAIMRDDKGSYAFVIDKQAAHRKDLKLGAEQNARTEILAGLAEKDSVISAGQQFVKNGAPVSVQK